MENRTLVFAGDSMAQLHFVSFGCLLMKSISYEPRIVEKTGIVNHEGKKMTGCIDVYFHQANFRIKFFRDNEMTNEDRLNYIMHGLTESDVLVTNTGAWYNWKPSKFPESVFYLKRAQVATSRETRDAAVAKLVQRYDPFRKVQVPYKMLLRVLSQRRRQPWLIVRENTPQHFDSLGGLWPGAQSGPTGLTTPCKQRPIAEIHSVGKWQMTAVEHILENVSVLSVFDAAVGAARFHVNGSNGDLEKGKYDCTHFFLPGPIPDHWSYALYVALVAAG
jgi:hypothetical protein